MVHIIAERIARGNNPGQTRNLTLANPNVICLSDKLNTYLVVDAYTLGGLFYTIALSSSKGGTVLPYAETNTTFAHAQL